MKTRPNSTLHGLAVAWLALSLFACGSGEKPASTASAAAVPATKAPERAPAASNEAPAVALLEQDVAYGEGQKNNLVGFLAMPKDAAEPLPGIIVIHEWWGLNDQVKAMARKLAGEGYVALAVDLYGGATATTPDKAQGLMTTLLDDPEAGRKNLRQAYDYLEKYALAPRIGSIGWDLGGSWALQTALLYPDKLDALVMYYGQVGVERDQLGKLRLPILGFFGSEDKSIPVHDVQNFRTTLNDLGKNAEVLIMIGADHGFANPSGRNYNAQSAAEAWAKTLEFLKHNLKVIAETPAQ
ncbi:MAG: dienelactone hydrolase family protein [Gammaproteobacteria bacterium]